MAKDPRKLAAVWNAGRLEWKFDENQASAYQLIQEIFSREDIAVLNMSRQIGKSYFLVVLCCMLALRMRRARIKYAAETAKQVRAIVRPHFQELFADCPIHIRPVFNSQDGEYRFPTTGSTITLAGCETDEDANKLLGQHAHLWVVDEAGSLKNLNYVVRTVLMPQTLNTGGKGVISSTPAKTADHPFKGYCDSASAVNALIERDIYCNPRIDEKTILRLMAACGGEDSTDWQREYLVRHVTDQNLQIVKFATPRRLEQITLKIDPEREKANPFYYRPDFFDPYAGLDLGWAPDATGKVWGYLDYREDTLVIEDEWFLRRMDTNTLAAVGKTREKELYGGHENVFQRWGDLEERTQQDLVVNHDYLVHRTQKENLKGAVNTLNLAVADLGHHLRIHPRCKQLKEQLRDGVWDKEKKKFARSPKHGHYDLLAALVYLTRNVQWDKVPDRMVTGHGRNMLVVPEDEPGGGVLGALRSALGLD